MSKQPNDTGPDLIVVGLDDGKPRAAKFAAGEAKQAAKAAKALNFIVCKADGAVLAQLAKSLSKGRLYPTGGAFLPPIGRKLYDEIVEQLKCAGHPLANGLNPGLPATWDDIAVGHLVVAPEEGRKPAWWEAIVLARDNDMLTLKWRDWPGHPNIVRHAGAVALLKPNPVNS